MIMIRPLCEIDGQLETVKQIKDIFFQASSVTSFSSEESKNKFFNRWLGQYLDQFPENTFVALEENIVLGYITGCLQTLEMWHSLDQSNLELWRDHYQEYPAHLHINCHADARGKGVGANLLSAFEDHCLKLGVSGLHLITLSSARNVSFYLRNGYIEVDRQGESPDFLVFLGKKFYNA